MCLIGGVKKQQQLRSLAKGAQIVIATPGRLNDILETSEVKQLQMKILIQLCAHFLQFCNGVLVDIYLFSCLIT